MNRPTQQRQADPPPRTVGRHNRPGGPTPSSSPTPHTSHSIPTTDPTDPTDRLRALINLTGGFEFLSHVP
ncbi:MAG: hypothetical protein OXI96_00560 [Acidimicrobiaceae bacterium]|nr:hypothetical protein [Acidimicrobiaceae bacterium]